MPATSEMYKRTYCRTAPDACARRIVLRTLGVDRVPRDLLPNQMDRAIGLIGN